MSRRTALAELVLSAWRFVGKIFMHKTRRRMVNQTAENGKSKDLAKRVGKFVKSLAGA
jgi:hypothetical protein